MRLSLIQPHKAAHFVGHWFPPWALQFPHRLIWGPPWGQSPPSFRYWGLHGAPLGPHGAPHGAPWGAQWGPVSPMGDNIFSYPILKGKYPIQRIADLREGLHVPLLCSCKISSQLGERVQSYRGKKNHRPPWTIGTLYSVPILRRPCLPLLEGVCGIFSLGQGALVYSTPGQKGPIIL